MPPRSPFVRSLLLTCALATGLAALLVLSRPLLLAQALETGAGDPSPSASVAATAPPAKSSVSLVSTDVAIPQDGRFAFDAVVSLAKPTPYLQVRLRIRRPSGRLLFQKTYIKTNEPAGTLRITFSRAIADLDLRPDIYPAELTVSAEGASPNSWKVSGALRVYDPASKPARVAVVVKISSPPAVDPQGQFLTDPGLDTRARDEALDLADAIIANPTMRASLAIPPELLQEWKSITSGYTLATNAGLVKVGADQAVPRSYADTLQHLGAAIATSRLELLDVPYADPEMAGLSSSQRVDDLALHLRLGGSTYRASIDETASGGTFPARGCITAAEARVAAQQGVRYAIVSPRYVRSGAATPTAGTYTSPRVALTVLVADSGLGTILGSGTSTGTADALFERALGSSKDASATGPASVLIEVGPGHASTVEGFMQRVAPVLGQPWVSFVTAQDAAAVPHNDPELTLVTSAKPPAHTPAGWWSSASASRRYADALVAVLGQDDSEAAAALANSLIAQSSAWAGPDGKFPLADRGRAFSAAALRAAQSVLGSVRVSARDLTLSGSSGSVPFSITNDSGRTLNVVLRFTTQKLTLRSQSLRETPLLPADNYITVPVQLKAAVKGTLRLQVVAGTLVIASTDVTVHASYLDRLAIVGAIAVVLGVMLFYIRRRVRQAEPTMARGNGQPEGAATQVATQTTEPSGEATTAASTEQG